MQVISGAQEGPLPGRGRPTELLQAGEPTTDRGEDPGGGGTGVTRPWARRGTNPERQCIQPGDSRVESWGWGLGNVT